VLGQTELFAIHGLYFIEDWFIQLLEYTCCPLIVHSLDLSALGLFLKLELLVQLRCERFAILVGPVLE
jgi:hypothetical protein